MNHRVLIVGTVPYNPQSTSRAFASYFEGWEKKYLRQIFSDPREPRYFQCESLFQITDKDILLSRLKLKKGEVGKKYNDKDNVVIEKSRVGLLEYIIRFFYRLGKQKNSVNHLMRGWLWKEKIWRSQKLSKWVDDFKPECIFLAFSDDFFILRIALYFANKYNIPIVSCIGDDYVFNGVKSLSPFYHIYRKKYLKLVSEVLNREGGAIYICDKIKEKYNRNFLTQGMTVYLSSDLQRLEFKPIPKKNPAIVYCGNIGLGRWKSIISIAEVIYEYNNSYKIQVYSNEETEKEIKELKRQKNINFGGKITYDIVKTKMESCDILIIVEDVDAENIIKTKYSLSTKISDSLATRAAIITYGSRRCAAIEYMDKINCGPVAESKNELKFMIAELIENVEYQKEIYLNKIKIFEENHNIKRSAEKVNTIIEQAIKGYMDAQKL